MWFLQIDTLGLILLFTLVYCLTNHILRLRGRSFRTTPFLLVFDLLLLLYVSWRLALFYMGYTIVSYLLVLWVRRAARWRRAVFVAASVLAVLPFFYARLQPFTATLPPILVLIGFSYNMLKAVDAIFYVYYTDRSIKFLAYANFLLFFPVITAGPIFRYRDFIKYYDSPRPPDAAAGTGCIKRIIRGLFKKLVLVAWLQQALAFLLNQGAHCWVSILLTFLSYAVLYLDLSGYSDIAIGVGTLLGIPTPENFKSPLQAATFTQFWRKWHVTLSDWIREHIFVVVSGRRLNRYVGALVGMGTMIVMSLWHEFSVLSVVDGIYMGSFLAYENLFQKTTVNKRKTPKSIYFLHCAAVTFFFGINAMIHTIDAAHLYAVLGGFFRL